MRRMVRKCRFVFFVLAIMICINCLSVSAMAVSTQNPAIETSGQQSSGDASYPGLTIEATMGYDGVITYLRKLPVRISLQNSGGDLSGILALNVYRNEVQYDRYELPVQVASGAEVQVEMPVELTMKQKIYRLELLVDGQCVATQKVDFKRVIDPATLLVATMSENTQSLSQFVITSTKDPLKRGEKWQTVSLTEATFPRDERMMQAFAFLAVDGVDLNTLDERQQSTLDAWLRAGGIVILGGGAQAGTAYPYFEKYSGISAGSASRGADITEKLLAYVKAAEKPLGEGIVLTEMRGAQNPLVSMDTPLLDLQPVGNGYIMTAAFSLSDKPLNTWQSTNVLWQRLMLTAIGDRYQQIVNKQVDYYGRETDYIDSSIMSSITIANDNSFLMPLVVLLVFVALVGFGSYWLLKKKDKREWMWATIPVLSIGFALLLLLIGNWTTFKQPVAVFSDYISQDEDGVVAEKARVSAAIPDYADMTVSVDKGEVVVAGNQSSYYDTGDGSSPSEPNQLRYTYRQGEASSLTFPAKASWGINSFFIKGNRPPNVKVNGTCWWEEDGLHIRLINEGDYALSKGYVLTETGYCSVRELLPGETVECLLANPPKEKTKGAAQYNGNGNPPISDGVLLSKTQQAAANLYSIIAAIVYPEMWTDSPDAVSLSDAVYTERSSKESMLYDCINTWNWYSNNNIYHYVTFDDSLCDMVLTLNGQTVQRTAQQNVVDITLAYQPVSQSGLAKFTRGMIPVYQADRDEGNDLIRGTQINDRYRYYRLVDKPVFCFVLPDVAKGIKVSDVDINSDYIWGDYSMRLYNAKTGEWVDVNIKKSIKDQLDFSIFVNEAQEMYVQFLPGTSTEAYAELNVPFMTLEGRIQ